MTIKEITYMLMDTVRGGFVTDDERLTHRLLTAFVNQKRAEFIVSKANSAKHMSENNSQSIDLELDVIDNGIESILVSTTDIPNIIFTRHGSTISEIYSNDDKYQYPYTFVNFSQLRFSGNGKFNSSIVYVAFRDGKLYFKSKSLLHKLIEGCRIEAVFENPLDVPGFDEDNDDYPLDLDGIDYIKDSIFKGDLKMFLNGIEDEVSDSNGEILT